MPEYTERRFDSRRRYRLEESRIHVSGRDYLHRDFETTIALANLNPEIERLRLRSSSFFGGLWLSLGAGIVTFVLVEGFGRELISTFVGLFAFLALCGVLVMVATIRKTEFAVFQTKAGVPALMIGKAGKEKDKFDVFITELAERIKGEETST